MPNHPKLYACFKYEVAKLNQWLADKEDQSTKPGLNLAFAKADKARVSLQNCESIVKKNNLELETVRYDELDPLSEEIEKTINII